jgi:hypothetical protein
MTSPENNSSARNRLGESIPNLKGIFIYNSKISNLCNRTIHNEHEQQFGKRRYTEIKEWLIKQLRVRGRNTGLALEGDSCHMLLMELVKTCL